MNETIYLVDDEPQLLELMTLLLKCKFPSCRVRPFADPKELLEQAKKSPPNLVLSDYKMPIMTGIELLEEIRKFSPTTIRIIISGYIKNFNKITAAHQYLAKPCTANELQKTISQALSAHPILNNNPNLCKAVSELQSVPAVPKIYNDLIEIFNQPDYDIHDVSDIIMQDAGIVTKIIQISNSPLFRGDSPILNITEAITCLGASNIKVLILALQVFSSFENTVFPYINISHQWQHCCATARLTQQLCKLARINSSNAFMAGLMHDLGKLVLIENCNEQYKKICQKAINKKQPLIDAEREELNIHNTEITGFLLKLWGMPEEIIDAIVFHKRPWEKPHPNFNCTDALYIANTLLHQQKNINSFTNEPINNEYLTSLGVNDLIETLDKNKQN